MSHQWDRGILNASSWHGLEEVGELPNAEIMIDRGEDLGAYPIALDEEALTTASGLVAPANAYVASYRNHARRVLGINGARYTPTTPQEWRQLIHAAVDAGAQPTGAFSLRGGSRVLATFEVGESNGLKTNLLLVDSFDGSCRLSAGFTSIRVVCANTLSFAFSQDSKDMTQLRHTASLPDKISILNRSIDSAIKSGQSVRETYEKAAQMKLDRDSAMVLFDALWPEAGDDASQRGITRAANARADAARAMKLDVNSEGKTLATIWNAATWLVDRKFDSKGQPMQRACRGGADMIDSLLFGQRSKRLQAVQEIVEVVLTDGSVERLSVAQAREHGIDEGQIGSALLESMLS